MKKHAVRVALDKFRSELTEAMDREPRAEDFNAAKCITVSTLGDLDGDGESDSEISLCLPPGGHVWAHYLYLSNKGCAKAVDPLVDAELTVLDSKSNGVKDLESTAANGCAGNDFTWTRYRWDGKSYRKADSATCSFCTDQGQKPLPGANRHAYCKKELARRKKEK